MKNYKVKLMTTRGIFDEDFEVTIQCKDEWDLMDRIAFWKAICGADKAEWECLGEV